MTEQQHQIIYCQRCGKPHQVVLKHGRLVGLRKIRCCGLWLETGRYRVCRRLDEIAKARSTVPHPRKRGRPQ